jgi:hypothetical protein
MLIILTSGSKVPSLRRILSKIWAKRIWEVVSKKYYTKEQHHPISTVAYDYLTWCGIKYKVQYKPGNFNYYHRTTKPMESMEE